MMGDSEIIGDLVSQSQAALYLAPDLSDKYRCMVVWDTRVNRDVGWLMVRRNVQDVLKPEEMEDEMEKCQWRSCNLEMLSQNSSNCDGNSLNTSSGSKRRQESESNETTDVVRMNYDEASTSTETKMDSAPSKQMVDSAVQVLDNHLPSISVQQVEFEDRPTTMCSRGSNQPSQQTKLEEMSAVNIDMFENAEVVNMPPADVNNNEISTGGPESSMKQVAVPSRMKKLKGVRKVGGKRLSKGTGEALDKEVLQKNQGLVSTPCCLPTRKPAVLPSPAGWQDCPECGKIIREKSLNNHMFKIHNIKSDLTTCNVCRKLVSELNLLNHRKTLHPERFKSDRITCSGCNLVLRALDFDDHECGVDDAESLNHVKGVAETLVGKDIGVKNMDQESDELLFGLKEENGEWEDVVNSGISCPLCQEVFADESIKLHDCKRKAFVMMKRIKLVQLNPEAGSRNQNEQSSLKVDDLKCEDCGDIFESLENPNKHDRCSALAKEQKDLVKKCEDEESDLKEKLTAAKVTEQPPQWLKRGEKFNFSVQLLSNSLTPLQIMSVPSTSCSGSCVVQVLQADDSTTLQQLLVSICSTTKAGLQRCLVPSQFVCRQVSRDMLQFNLQCDQHCGSKDNRFKMVVATKQAVLCFSREMFVHKNSIKTVEGRGTVKNSSEASESCDLPVLATPEINEKVARVKTQKPSSGEDNRVEGEEREVSSDEWAWDCI